MLRFIIKRIVWFIPTLFLVTMICFILFKNSSGNAVNMLINIDKLRSNSSIENQKKYWENKLRLNFPIFYFSVNTLSEGIPLNSNNSIIRNYIPNFRWYGTNNQYHIWLLGNNESKGIFRGDFGISYLTKQPVISIIKDKIGWTLFFSISSIMLAYLISIPLGIRLASFPKKKSSKLIETILFLFYSMPSFFVGVLLLMLFANPSVISILPPSGIKPIGGYDDNASIFEKIRDSIPYIILPLITYVYALIAFLSKLTAVSINEQLTFDYIRTAKAVVFSNKQVIWKHALKNSIIPMVTVFTFLLPTVIGGSVIVESIFSIPGMGSEIVKSILTHDYPIIIAFVTLTTLLTISSYLISDILNALIDPRIKNA